MAQPFTVGGWDFSPDQIMSPEDVAAAFGVRVETVGRWDKVGKLTSIRTPGNTRRFSRQQVEAIMRGGAS